MINIKVSKLKHNPEIFKKIFQVKKENTITTKKVMMVFPERYIQRELVFFDSTIKVLNIVGIIDEDNNYCSFIAPLFIDTVPYNIEDITIDGVLHKCLTYEADSVIIQSNSIIKSETSMYNIFDEMLVQGRVPWYVDYDNIKDIFINAGKYAGSKVGKNPLAYEIIASEIARDKDDKNKYFRLNPKGRPTYVGLNNLFYSFKTTDSKLIGGYYGYGVSAAINNPETETSKISEILRK